MKIRILSNHFSTRGLQLKKLRSILSYVVDNENYKLSSINILFVGSAKMKSYNKEFLNHDYDTDIITFGYNTNKDIEADILICIPFVKSNSVIFETSFRCELYRVAIHGVLHLTGYNDTTRLKKLKMTEREDFYLKKFKIK